MTVVAIHDFHGEGAAEWDEVYLAGQLLPGIATVAGPGVKRAIDKKKQKGQSGASLKDEGDELAEGDITLHMANGTWNDGTASAVDQWNEFVRIILPLVTPRRKDGLKQPLSLRHPIPNALGIQNVYCEQIPFPDHDKEQGTITVKLGLVEWVAQPKPTRGVGGGGKSDKSLDYNFPSELQAENDPSGTSEDDIIDESITTPDEVLETLDQQENVMDALFG